MIDTEFDEIDQYSPAQGSERQHVDRRANLWSDYSRSPRHSNIVNRFLQSSVGALWGDVYSRWKQRYAHLSFKGEPINLNKYVETKVYRDADGELAYCDRYGVFLIQTQYAKVFYVDPITKQLQVDETQHVAATYLAAQQREAVERAKTRLIVSPTLQFHKLNGLWFEITTRPFTLPCLTTDVILGALTPVYSYQQAASANIKYKLHDVYGRKLLVMGVTKRSASRSQIQQYNLPQ